MELDEMLKLNNTIVIRWVLEDILESPYCTWFERDEGDEMYEDYICYRITLKSPVSDFENATIKVYV